MNNSRCSSCGFISFATATQCKRCGKAISFETANPNAFNVEDVWRDADQLVIKHGAELPDRCIVCNAPAGGRRYPLKLAYDAKLHKAHLAIGTVKISYKETELPVGFCRTHFMRQAYSSLAGIFTMVAGFGFFIFSMTRENTLFLLLGMAAAMIVIVAGVGLLKAAPVNIERSEDSNIWLKGVCSQYLLRLPNWQ